MLPKIPHIVTRYLAPGALQSVTLTFRPNNAAAANSAASLPLLRLVFGLEFGFGGWVLSLYPVGHQVHDFVSQFIMNLEPESPKSCGIGFWSICK